MHSLWWFLFPSVILSVDGFINRFLLFPNSKWSTDKIHLCPVFKFNYFCRMLPLHENPPQFLWKHFSTMHNRISPSMMETQNWETAKSSTFWQQTWSSTPTYTSRSRHNTNQNHTNQNSCNCIYPPSFFVYLFLLHFTAHLYYTQNKPQSRSSFRFSIREKQFSHSFIKKSSSRCVPRRRGRS